VRTALALVLVAFVAGCMARSYRPTTARIARANTTRVDLMALDLVVNEPGDGEVIVDARVSGDGVVHAVRLATAEDPPCGGGKLARSVIVDGRPQPPIEVVIEGAARIEASFAPSDLRTRLDEPAFLDIEADDGCVRVDLIRDDGTVEWVESPDWAVGGSLDGFVTERGPMRGGALANLWVERNLRWLVVGATLRLGRADGRDPWEHVDVLAAAPSLGLRLASRGRWVVTANAAYDLILPAGFDDDDSDFLDLVQGPRVTVRAGYGGEPVPWRAFRTRHAASALGLELFGARWSESGWVIGGGVQLSVGR
jgi:hypothetical protein